MGEPAGDEEEQEREALVWLKASVADSGQSFPKLYKVLEAKGIPHPEGGASPAEMGKFALAVFRDAEVREALEQSGFVLKK